MSLLKDRTMPFSIQWVELLPSTNQFMKDALLRGEILPEGTVVSAHEQTAGRGRFERVWIAPPRTNLTFSILHYSHRSVLDTASLPMAAAMGVVDFLERCGIQAKAKWPNDVLVDDIKICGILSERMVCPDGSNACIIGLGLNVNMTPAELQQIDQLATSMYTIMDMRYAPEEILPDLLNHIDVWLQAWDAGGFARIAEGWSRRTAWLHELVKILDGDVVRHGMLVGFSDHGALLLDTGGGVETIWNGDLRRDM